VGEDEDAWCGPQRPPPRAVSRNYCVQLDAICFTDCTRTRCPPDIDDELRGEVLLVSGVPAVLDVPDELLLLLESDPVISTFSPTCLLSSLSWPSRM